MKINILNEAIEVHNTLNPKLWDANNNLKQDIRDRICEIILKYIEDSEILKPEDIIDVELLGSNASFNYTKDSDLDIHLVVNMQDISCDTALLQLACNSEKALFNKAYDIKIKGIDVELYVEDVGAGTVSNGIYSITKDSWIKFPVKIDIPDISHDQEFITVLSEWKSKAAELLNSESEQDIQLFINELYNMRRLSIMMDGEYSLGNLVFKEIRNIGLLQQLKDRRNILISQKLTLEKLSK